MNKTLEQEKTEILAEHLGIDLDDAERFIDDGDYLVLTDSEADEFAKDYIMDSLWAFNADFIIEQCDLDYSLSDMLKSWQSEKCESANDEILSLIKNSCGIDDFVEAAIGLDGRGHFISSYDGYETEYKGFYIYRQN